MAQMLIASKDGPDYVPPACTSSPFSDVSASNPICPWVQELVRRGVTAGCGGGQYCPNNPVTRSQMSVFLLSTWHGAGYCAHALHDLGLQRCAGQQSLLPVDPRNGDQRHHGGLWRGQLLHRAGRTRGPSSRCSWRPRSICRCSGAWQDGSRFPSARLTYAGSSASPSEDDVGDDPRERHRGDRDDDVEDADHGRVPAAARRRGRRRLRR